MSILNRRSVLIAFMAATLFVQPVSALAKGDLVYVGQRGTKVHALRFDAAKGEISLVGAVAELVRPTGTTADPLRPVLYVADASGGDGKSNGTVVSYRIDRHTGLLSKISQVEAGGGGTTHLWFDAPSSTLLAANYAGGNVATLPVSRDGSLGKPISLVQSVGTGPNRRQASPHAHGVALDPSGRFALVADLGADRLFVYPFSRRSRVLSPDMPGNERHFIAPPGSGPRHLATYPNGRFVYLLTELTAQVHALRWNAARGTLTSVQSQPTNSPGFAGTASASEIITSRDGRFVYVGNRGENTLVVYRADARTGILRDTGRWVAVPEACSISFVP